MEEIIRKTIKVKVSSATNQTKLDILQREYDRWQEILDELEQCRHHDFPVDPQEDPYNWIKTSERHSQYVSYATFNDCGSNHPMVVKNSYAKLERRDTEIGPYWFSVPTLERRGGVWLPLELPHRYYGFDEEWDIRDSWITKDGEEWYIHINVEREVDIREQYDGVLGIDLGVRYVAVTWDSTEQQPQFYGNDLREVRGKYHYLRRKLQQQRKDEAVEQIADREKRKVTTQLHQISREIVDHADDQNLAIVIGDLSGYRGKKFDPQGNRKLNSAPIHKLKQFIQYKAKEAGIACQVVDESYTTVTCSDCGHERESRPGKEFSCPDCGYQVNADVNSAKNITERGFGYISKSGAFAVSSNPRSDETDEAQTTGKRTAGAVLDSSRRFDTQ